MFHPFTQNDLPLLWERQQSLHSLSSEFDAFRVHAWLQLDGTQIAYWRNQFVLRCQAPNEPWYIAPGETESFSELLVQLIAYEQSQGAKAFHFLNVERPASAFPEGFTACPKRDLFDYLYRAEDLLTLPGRAYASKRNLISQFKRKYDWRFEPISSENRDACRALLSQWDKQHQGVMLAPEREAIERMLLFSQPYGQSGGILFADGQPAAFAIGSRPRKEVLDVVAEKANPEVTGAYAMMVQAYTQYAYSLAPFDFVNREEDMGLENLRDAKLQWKPAQLLEKTLMTYPLI